MHKASPFVSMTLTFERRPFVSSASPLAQDGEATSHVFDLYPGRAPGAGRSSLRPQAGGASFSTSLENGSTPGMSHFVHMSSIFAWK